MNRAALVLILAALLTPCGAAATDLVRASPGPPNGPTAAERARTEAAVRRLRADVNRTLASCHRARGLQQRCSCYGALRRAQGEVAREKRRVSNVMEIQMRVMKGSIRESNEDKKYWLSHLRQLNAMSGQLSDYLNKLTGHRRATGKPGVPRATTGGADAEPLSDARCRNIRSLRRPPARLRPHSAAARPAMPGSIMARPSLRQA